MRERRLGQRLDVVGGHEVATRQPGPGAGRPHEGDRAARAGAEPERRCLRGSRGPTSTTYPATSGETCTSRTARRPASMSSAPATAVTPGRSDVLRVEARGVTADDLQLLRPLGHREHDLEQEAVELGLGQRVGAFVLDRVLRRGDQERPRQRMAHAVDRDLPLLHRLEQRRLGLRRRAVDLVGEQEVGEHRSLAERQLAAIAVDHHRAGDVARHQVGRELHATRLHRERARRGCAPAGSWRPRARPPCSTWPPHSSATSRPDTAAS